ncbi:MAG TPA: PEP-CTERM sorting domain-containing protein [Candidatus Dormibacteraeota bacterium]|nr:PEP-CTERM sorting domain-containing protein [Candidatus Dormibacteraeota bacterium]
MLSLSNAELIRIGNLTGSNLGFINFTTGDMTSGSSLGMGGTFAAGGTFTITGTYGNITNGTLFSGTFSGPVTWTLNSATNCTSCTYTLSGVLSGTWFVKGMQSTTGATVQIDFTSNGLYKGGKITDVGGVSYVNIPAIPEPASIGFVGTGLIAMGLLVRRRAKGAASSETNWR